MGLRPPSIWPGHHLGAIDARAIVPVKDRHGGLTIYMHGRPTHYLLDGDWYAAAPRRGPEPAALTTPCDGHVEDYPDGEGKPQPYA